MNTKKTISSKPALLIISAVLMAFALLISLPAPSVSAQTAADCEKNYPDNNFDNDGYKECMAALDGSTGSREDTTEEDLEQAELVLVKDNDTVANVQSNPIYILLLDVLNFLTAGVGLVVTTLIVVGGIQYMTAGGNPQKTQAAIMRIANALIGLVLYILMFAILQWLIPGGLFG